MKRPGQIVVFNFPRTDFGTQKSRPSLLLNKLPGGYDDWLIAMISTKLHQNIEGMDEIINPDSPDFSSSGLSKESVIRITRLAVVAGDILIGALGEISPKRLARIRDNLANWIKSGGKEEAASEP